MASLVIAEHDNRALSDATAKTVAASSSVSCPVHVLVAGQNCASVVAAAAKIKGVEKVIVAEDPLYLHMMAETMETLLLSLADKYDAILAPATSNGKNILPRVAAKLDVPQISEIIKVVSPDTFERPIYAGNAIQTVEAKLPKKIITVRTTAFKAPGEGGSAAIEKIS
ncbi:MAG TPA: electron transfer flavoprotein subunit alpha/FixB family protein, partial [Rhizomicrobium sp.]|nr:electron transfer flavoprotein subunit alpha/FixB family protein [Rhizomicrobium sp.]